MIGKVTFLVNECAPSLPAVHVTLLQLPQELFMLCASLNYLHFKAIIVTNTDVTHNFKKKKKLTFELPSI